MNSGLTTILAAVVMSTVACGSTTDTSATEDPFANARVGLCQAAAVSDRPAEARAVFFDSVHEPLHELADETAARDRVAAGTLLEAKQRVEADFASDDTALPEDLDRLVDATDAALSALDQPPLNCGKERK